MSTPPHRVLKEATDVSPSIRTALTLLYEAFAYSQDLDLPIWEFAVEVQRLREVHVTNSDLRWLLCKGYSEQGIETTSSRQEERSFQRTGNLAISDATCFVSTHDGVSFSREIGVAPPVKELASSSGETSSDSPPSMIVWDGDRRILRVGDTAVKQYRVPAPNQELILSVFQEENWPARIDDPLPQNGEVDPKRRLHTAINCLNRNQMNSLIRFHGDGRGNGIYWQIVLHDDGLSEEHRDARSLPK